jgi:hypothetical protein
MKQRIAVVAVSALTAGLFSVVSAPAANATANGATGATNAGTAAQILNIATKASVTGAGVASVTIADNRSLGLLANSTTQAAASSVPGTATILSNGEIVFYYTGLTQDAASTFVVSGGTITKQAVTATTGITSLNGFKTQLVAADITVPLVAAIGVTPNAGVTSFTVSVYDAAATAIAVATDAGDAGIQLAAIQAGTTSKGTLTGTYIVSVVAAASAGTFSPSKSFFAGVTAAVTGAHATNVDDAFSLQAANGAEAKIAFSLKDALGLSMPITTVITASATNGAVVAFATTAQLGASVTSTYGGTFGNIFVAQGTAYAAIDTVVTLSVNGVVYSSKPVALQGDVTKITLSDNVVGKLAQNTGNAYFTTATDALGHKIGGILTSIDATQFNTSVTTAAAATTTANTGAATSALFTCGTVAGKTNFKVTFTNPTSLVKVTSNALDLLCGGTPYTWSASLDKASYVPGDIATLTVTAKDITGAVVNDVDTMGASITVTGSQLTPVVTPVTGDTFTSGVKKYTFLVGPTSGSYNAVVSIPFWTGGANSSSAAQTAQTVKYAVASDGSVSNADVLKSIVALIASINKQIQALQKLILARR